MSQSKHLFFVIAVVFFAATIAEADIISVNFHVEDDGDAQACLLYTSPSPRDRQKSRMPSSA